jgi:hypothetical protein
MRCAACNRTIEMAPGERIGFREACEGCGADLHSCVQCAHYDPGAYNDCREPSAEYVSDRERANRCEWFQPGERAGAGGGERSRALADLDALFKK